jgi:diguanylate cyclase (GGDEF)-like protein/PAS domain S-box-containing protein
VSDVLYLSLSVWAIPGLNLEQFDYLWTAAYVLLAAAAWHPTMRQVDERFHSDMERLSPRRLAALAVAALLAPATLALQAWRGHPISISVIAGGSSALFLCTLLRVTNLVHQLERALVQRSLAETEAREAEARYRRLVEHIPAAVYVVDRELLGVPRYVSPRIEAIAGYPASDWLTKPGFWMALLHQDDRDWVLREHQGAQASMRPLCLEYRLVTADGRVVWVRDEAVWHGALGSDGGYWQGFLLDITDRKRAEEELAYHAFHDSLTGLPNRALFLDRLERALHLARRSSESVAVLFLDLDRFKLINDSLGHDAGDQYLITVAQRLARVIRDGDTVARFGGDEFTVLLERVTTVNEATTVAERLIAALETPFVVAGREVTASTSIGIALATEPGVTATDLLREADAALYRAKVTKRGGYLLFEKEMAEEAVGTLEVEAALRQALRDGALRVHYQPLINLEDGRIVEIEALVRWEHPTRGLLGPSEFIGLAEETGLIVPLGQWVLQTACRQMQHWIQTFPDTAPAAVSINLSPRQLIQPDFATCVQQILSETGLAPAALQLEITERMALDDSPHTIRNLTALKRLGIRLAIDDFGAKHAGFASLKHRAIDVLKIDRVFTAGLCVDREDSAIVRAILDFAKALGITVVAEGIESAEQVTTLRAMGCMIGQGFFFEHALSAEDLEALIARGHRWPVEPFASSRHGAPLSSGVA